MAHQMKSITGNKSVLALGGTREDRIHNLVERLLIEDTCNLVIPDYEGALYSNYANYMEKKGYKVYKLDLREGQSTVGYNFIANSFIDGDENRTIENVDIVAQEMIREIDEEADILPFSKFKLRIFLMVLIGYLLAYAEMKYRDLYNVKDILEACDYSNDSYNCTPFDIMIEQVESHDPDSWVVDMYKMVPSKSPQKMRHMKTILLKLIDTYLSKKYNQLISGEDLNISALTEEKSVLFICTEGRLDPFCNIIVNQLLTTLQSEAIVHGDERNTYPVKVIVDDFLVNSMVCKMYDKLDYLRRNNHSVVYLLDNEEGLVKFSDNIAPSDIIGRFDEFVYLGGDYAVALCYIADCTGSKVTDLLDMPFDYGWIVDKDKEAIYQKNWYKQMEVKNIVGEEYRDMEIANDYTIRFSKESKLYDTFVSSVNAWLQKTSYSEFREEIYDRVKGQEQLDLVLINIYNYLENISRGTRYCNNTIIAAPSGCGKTETYRAIKEYFAEHIKNLPIAQVDMTGITEEGFRGKDTYSLLEVFDKKEETMGEGIIFLDEFDKKMMPSWTAQNQNVNQNIQSQLLVTIEGTEVVMRTGRVIDTSRTMFIGLGAFDMCRDKKEVVVRHIGFGAEDEGGMDHYADITREDMIDLGASYELLGRFGTIVNYHKLSANSIDHIVDEMVKNVGKAFDTEIQISDDFRQELHGSANSKYGCRLLESKIRNEAMKVYLKIKKEGLDARTKTMIIGVNGNCQIVDNLKERWIEV